MLPTPHIVAKNIDTLSNSFYPMPHRVAAYYLAQEPWLQFLVTHGLASDDRAERLRKDLRAERQQLVQSILDETSDPFLIHDLEKAGDFMKDPPDGKAR